MKKPESGITVLAQNKKGMFIVLGNTVTDEFWEAIEEAGNVEIGVRDQEDLLSAIYDISDHLESEGFDHDDIAHVQAFVANTYLDKITDIDAFEEDIDNEYFHIDGNLEDGFKGTAYSEVEYYFVTHEELELQEEKNNKRDSKPNLYGSMEP